MAWANHSGAAKETGETMVTAAATATALTSAALISAAAETTAAVPTTVITAVVPTATVKKVAKVLVKDRNEGGTF